MAAQIGTLTWDRFVIWNGHWFVYWIRHWSINMHFHWVVDDFFNWISIFRDKQWGNYEYKHKLTASTLHSERKNILRVVNVDWNLYWIMNLCAKKVRNSEKVKVLELLQNCMKPRNIQLADCYLLLYWVWS